MSYTIFTYAKTHKATTQKATQYISKLYRWLASERSNLFSLIEYHPALPLSSVGIPFKIGSTVAASSINKVIERRQTIAHLESRVGQRCFIIGLSAILSKRS